MDEILADSGYVMWSNSAYYREYYFPVSYAKRTVSDGNTVRVTTYNPDGKDEAWKEKNDGWHSIVSPYTFSYAPTGVSLPWLIVSEMTEDNRTYWQHPISSSNPMRPARPYIIQANGTGNMQFGNTFSFSPVSAGSAPSSVRAESSVATSPQLIRLTATGSDGLFDEANIAFSSAFSLDYERGYDVQKMLTEGQRVQLYMSLGCGNLAAAALPDDVGVIPLSLYAPLSDTYTFSVDETSITDRLEHLWLIEDGELYLADLLTEDYVYAASEGTTRRLSLGVVIASGDISGVGDSGNSEQGSGTATYVDGQESGTVRVITAGGKVFVSGTDADTPIRLYDATGKLILSTKGQSTNGQVISISLPTTGVYMLQVGNETRKIIY